MAHSRSMNCFGFTFQTAKTLGISKLSLRANGSRECASDDRLREAIHLLSRRGHGLLRRFTPRNDAALISHTPPHSRGAMRPSFCKNLCPKKQRAQGKPGARRTRSLVRKV